MPFNFKKKEGFNYKSPQEMYQDNKIKTIRGLLDYQGKMIDKYMEHKDKKNVALELPTGSGKTLIGLLIGEYRRRKNKEIVVYLCPTKQLVNQVVNQATQKYGIRVIPFCGKQSDYNSKDKTNFLMGDSIGVTTYSAFFTQHNIFNNVDIIIMDDVHSCEDYIVSNWTLKIDNNYSTFSAIANILKDIIGESDYERLVCDNGGASDVMGWCNLIPMTLLKDRLDEIEKEITLGLEVGTSNYYAWKRINENLLESNFYISNKNILIRPWIAPTMTYQPYAKAKQRILMSATLGKSGELERVTGLENIYRLPIVGDWDKKGLGRRFFIMPDLSLDEEKQWEIFTRLHEVTDKKSVVLVPDDRYTRSIEENLDEKIDLFNAKSIEKSKDEFVKSKNAMVILANRFDGVDFADKESRMLFIIDLPKVTNIQEKFLVSRMGASILFAERIRTKIIQAVGRCSRNPSDYSVVCIMGDTILNDLIKEEKLNKYPLELRAELKFGIDMSRQYTDINQIIEQVDEFLLRKPNWLEAEEHIVQMRDDYNDDENKKENIIFKKLKNASIYEIKYQYNLWKKSYIEAYNSVIEVIKCLDAPSLSGYKSYWEYVAGSLAYIIYNCGNEMYKSLSISHYKKSVKNNISIKWIDKLIYQITNRIEKINETDYTKYIIFNIENYLTTYSIDRKFDKKVLEICSDLKSMDGNAFERGHKDLGELLGYVSINNNSIATPDPYWIVNSKLCIVSEDKIYDDIENEIPVKHVKEAMGHKVWIEKKEKRLDRDANIITIFVTNSIKIEENARIFAEDIFYINREEFVEWALKGIKAIKEIRKVFVDSGDTEWRKYASSILKEYEVTPENFMQMIKKKKLSNL